MHYKRFAVAAILFLNIHQQLLAMNKSFKQDTGYKNLGKNHKNSQREKNKLDRHSKKVNNANARREEKFALHQSQNQQITSFDQQFVAAIITQQVIIARTNNMP